MDWKQQDPYTMKNFYKKDATGNRYKSQYENKTTRLRTNKSTTHSTRCKSFKQNTYKQCSPNNSMQK